MKIPFHRPLIEDDDIEAVVATLKSGWLTTGPQAKAFEEDFCKYTGARHAVAVNSCTAAMHLALAGLRVGPGDAVITTPYTFVATAEAIQYVGARPIFVDIQESDFNITPEAVDEFIGKWYGQSGNSERITTVLPVHIAGHPCDVLGFKRLAEKYDLHVIEDAAHCLEGEVCEERSNGTSNGVNIVDIDFTDHLETHESGTNGRNGKPGGNGPASVQNYIRRHIGSVSDATCFSFYATKNITTAEGGMVTTNSDELAERLRLLAQHGMSRDAWKRYTAEGSWYYEIVTQGYKYNMPDLAAALGRTQLAKVDRMHSIRATHARILHDAFADVEEIDLPRETSDVYHAWHLFLIRLRLDRLDITRSEFILKLRKLGVLSSVHFIPLHLQPFFRDKYGYERGDFPVAEKVFDSVVSLPFYPAMTEEEVHYLAQCVRRLVKSNAKTVAFAVM